MLVIKCLSFFLFLHFLEHLVVEGVFCLFNLSLKLLILLFFSFSLIVIDLVFHRLRYFDNFLGFHSRILPISSAITFRRIYFWRFNFFLLFFWKYFQTWSDWILFFLKTIFSLWRDFMFFLFYFWFVFTHLLHKVLNVIRIGSVLVLRYLFRSIKIFRVWWIAQYFLGRRYGNYLHLNFSTGLLFTQLLHHLLLQL